MKNKTICVTDDIFEKLKGEYNASALINSLLSRHYAETSPAKNKLESKQSAIERLENQIKAEREAAEKIIIEQKEVEQIEAEKEAISAKRKADTDYLRARILEEIERQEKEENENIAKQGE